MTLTLRVLPCGDAALIVEFADTVDADVNARVLALDASIARESLSSIIETVPTYRSLLVHYDPGAIDFATLSTRLHALAESSRAVEPASATWRIPVVYGGAFGADLESVAARHGLTPQELVERHAMPVYRIFMIGFLPGFTYLGGLDPSIATPRLQIPRAKVPAGSIVIGGVQAAVGSIEGPSGWHLLGRTPVRAFMPGRVPAFFMQPGDHVVFEPISPGAYDRLEVAAGRGELVAERLS